MTPNLQRGIYPTLLFVFILSQAVLIGGARRYRGEEGPYFEGDMLNRPNRNNGHVHGKVRADGIIGQEYRWPQNTLVYEYAHNFPAHSRVTFERAMEHISARTCIRFRQRINNERNFIHVFDDRGFCYSNVGRIAGGNKLSLGVGCGFGSHVHELIHAIGFDHVQNRPDRDSHVIIHMENINPNFTGNFEKANSWYASTFDVEYDYNSIMHYGRDYFSINGGDTITPIRRLKPGEELGQRNGMSPTDVQKIQNMYCPPNIGIPRPSPIVPIGGGNVKFGAQIRNTYDGKCLDVQGGTAEGKPVITWEWNAGDNQKWNVHITDIRTTEATLESYSRSGGQIKFLHEDMSTHNVVVRGSSGRADQIWVFVNVGRTSDNANLVANYRIINTQSKRCLFSDRNNRVITTPCNSADRTQLWKMSRLDSLGHNPIRRSRIESAENTNLEHASDNCGIHGQFQCGDGTCINSEFVCDNDNDCTNGEDESNCPAQNHRTLTVQDPEARFKSAVLSVCVSGEFQCTDGQCISSIYKCDGDNDCANGEDELSCPGQNHRTSITVQDPEPRFKSAALPACESGEFQCNDGQCISSIYKCDGDNDCTNGEDELSCPAQSHRTTVTVQDPEPRFKIVALPVCSSGEFQCTDGQCISYIYKCDGDNDCTNGEDESICPAQNHQITGIVEDPEPRFKSAVLPVCVSGEFQCNDGQCITSIYKCDGDNDCTNGEDESNCPAQNIRIVTVQDPEPRFKSAVLPACSSGEFQCNDGQCISSVYKCDRDNDCTNGEDEAHCPSIGNTQQRFLTIGTNANLVPRSRSTCNSDQFQCNDGQCIQLSDKCDDFDDCNNSEDESNCEITQTSQPTLNTYPSVLTGKSADHTQNACSTGEFLCHDGQCIQSLFWCDGDADCEGGEDELTCG